MTSNIHSEQKQATWIWYPGDFEVWLGNKKNNRRTARGAFFPPFWKQDSHFVTVEFSKRFTLETSETITIMAEGKFNIKLDGEMAFGMPSSFHIPAGTHSLNIKVWNQETPPALFVDGPTLKSDSTWQVTNEDKEWIDDSGKASDTSASVYMDAGSWNFNSPAHKPSLFQLERTPMKAVSKENTGGGTLYDFGREMFGYLVFHGVEGEGTIHVYYGESREEAQDKDNCELLDKFSVHNGQICDLSINECCDEHGVTPNNKAFRYVFVTIEGGVTIGDVSMEYEYLPEESRGTFRCDDEEVNRMWSVGEYTLQLTAREFFIDGIKRDRWTWSGDAYQSYLMNYYLFFDSESVKRTTWQLRGKDPVTGHINTIMDYTFYWFMGIYNYYLYTGDRHFVNQIYPRMQTMMDYVLGRLDENGMLQGLSGDWVFIDWSPKPMSKQGELAFEQILFCKSLETMTVCATLVDEADDASKYQSLVETLKAKLIPTFWDEEKHALVHSVVNGLKGADVERYANMFAIFFGYLTEEQKRDVAEHVLHNDDVMPITTPYMRFYEMEALCQLGEQAEVMRQMKEYWGGMLRLGATSFWEAYDPSIPSENGIAPHLAMYGRPYGKSLCHAWGASPIYLLGKYFIGVRPVEPGYAKYEVRPVLGGLKWMEGTVPTPHGCIRVRMDEHAVTVKSDAGEGTLYIADKVVSIPAGQEITVEY